MTENMQVVSWNLQHTKVRASARLRLLQDLDSRRAPWDLLCAQEVLPELRDQIAGTFPGATVAYFIDQPGEREAGARSAAMLLARQPWKLENSRPLSHAPSSLRTATAVLSRDGHAVAAVASAALPPASMERWGVESKVEQAEAVLDWARRQAPLPVIIGLDANGPLFDTVSGPTFHDEREKVLFGFDGAPFVDAFRAQLSQEACARIEHLRPEGPLAVTHMAGGAPRRYDYVLTRDFDVLEAGYIIDDAFAAGSDHALAHALLHLPDDPLRSERSAAL